MKAASKNPLFLAQVLAALLVAILVCGLVLHGFSAEVHERLWRNVIDHPGGPMTFRFLLQPIMAALAALHDARRDATTGRSPYLWAILSNHEQRGHLLHEGIVSTARIILLGLCVDVLYQFIEFDTFFPAEAVVIALLLGFVPYLLLRGPFMRIASWVRDRPKAKARHRH